MSAWLRQQALAPAPARIARRALRRRHRQRLAAAEAFRNASVPTLGEGAGAAELARLSREVASLRRNLRRVGLACLFAVFLLSLQQGWPALRWLLGVA